jgi:hypothetical protein
VLSNTLNCSHLESLTTSSSSSDKEKFKKTNKTRQTFLSEVPMTKSFLEALEEWKNDNRYQIEEDIGWEFADYYESSPMLDERLPLGGNDYNSKNES